MASCSMRTKHSLLCGESTLDKYTVRVYARAYRDLDHIYAYIAEKLLAPDSALSLVSALEEAIYTLERLPE